MLYFNLVRIQTIFLDELVDGVLDSLLGLDYFLYEHFRSVLWVVALSDDSMVYCVIDACYTSGYQFPLSFLELKFLFLMLFNLNL